jgi:hypothetical protein
MTESVWLAFRTQNEISQAGDLSDSRTLDGDWPHER